MVEQHDFDAFYQAHFSDTVAMTYAYTGDLASAQDLAQEAFCRAWQRWTTISRYEAPVAWVRHVALNLARSRWRHLRIAAAHLVRQRVGDVAPPEPDHVALVAALRRLTEDQRRAVVLHHLMDMPIADVAHEMDSAEGTVKSWLSRGRAALASQLGDDIRDDVRARVTAPSADALRARADRSRNVRRATAAAAAAIVAVLVIVVTQLLPARQTPLPPTQSPTATAVPSPSPVDTVPANDPMRSVDWTTATLNLASHPHCPQGQVPFTTKDGGASGPTSWPRAYFSPGRVALGDLTGDGRAEAVFELVCLTGPEDSGDGVGELVAIERTAAGELRVLGWAGREGAIFSSYWITGGTLYSDTHPWHTNWGYRLGQVDAYRYTGQGFTEVGTGSAYPALYPTGERRLDLGSLPTAAQLPCGSLAPRDPGAMTFDAEGRFADGDRVWSINQPESPDNSPHFVVTAQRPRVVLLLAVGCAPSGPPQAEPNRTLIAFEAAPDGWHAVKLFPDTGSDSVVGWQVASGKVTVSYAPAGGGATHERTHDLPN